MSTPTRAGVAIVSPLMVGLAFLLATHAAAQPAPTLPPRCDGRAEQVALQHYQRSSELFRKGKYAESLEELDVTYRLCFNPLMLMAMAGVHESMGQLAEAVYLYRQYLAEQPEGKDAERASQAILRLETKLAESHGRLIVRSDPAGATALLDGNEGRSWQTPLDLWVPPGQHTVLLRKESFHPTTGEVEIMVAGTRALELKLGSVYADPSDGQLTVMVPKDAEGARVLVDGTFASLAPLQGYKLPAGSHKVVVVHDSYRPYEVTVEITPAKETELDAVLLLDPQTARRQEAEREGQGRAVQAVAELEVAEGGAGEDAGTQRAMWRKLAGWTAVGGAATALAGGTAFLWSWSRFKDAERGSDEEASAEKMGEFVQVPAWIGAGLGLAGAAAWFYLQRSDSEGQQEAGARNAGLEGIRWSIFLDPLRGSGSLMVLY